jgi:hypothetical protein
MIDAVLQVRGSVAMIGTPMFLSAAAHIWS